MRPVTSPRPSAAVVSKDQSNGCHPSQRGMRFKSHLEQGKCCGFISVSLLSHIGYHIGFTVGVMKHDKPF